jgi:hypothetical protein
MSRSIEPDRLFWLRLDRLGLPASPYFQPCQVRGLLKRLAAAIRAERKRCRQGHWTGDLNRLAGLRIAFRTLWPFRHAGRPPAQRS